MNANNPKTTKSSIIDNVVTFDNIPSRTVSVLASNYLEAIRDAVWGYKTVVYHNGLRFVVTHSGEGFVTKVTKGDFYGYQGEGDDCVATYDYELTVVSATDIANAAFVALTEVRAARGRAFEEHAADGWYLRGIIDAPTEWLDAIQKAQPEEARALKGLKELQERCAVAGKKASLSLRALEATGETVELRTLDTHEKLSFSWDYSYQGEEFFRAEDADGRSSTWTLRDICLRTNILDII